MSWDRTFCSLPRPISDNGTLKMSQSIGKVVRGAPLPLRMRLSAESAAVEWVGNGGKLAAGERCDSQHAMSASGMSPGMPRLSDSFGDDGGTTTLRQHLTAYIETFTGTHSFLYKVHAVNRLSFPLYIKHLFF